MLARILVAMILLFIEPVFANRTVVIDNPSTKEIHNNQQYDDCVAGLRAHGSRIAGAVCSDLLSQNIDIETINTASSFDDCLEKLKGSRIAGTICAEVGKFNLSGSEEFLEEDNSGSAASM